MTKPGAVNVLVPPRGTPPGVTRAGEGGEMEAGIWWYFGEVAQ